MSDQFDKLQLPASAHVRARNIDLGKSLQGKAKIYLDQRWWVHCRQTQFGEPCTDERRAICDQLQKLVRDGKAICPAAEPVLSELLKIPTDSTRRNMAAVIDELSLGCSLQSQAILDRIELLNVLTRLLKVTTEGYSIQHLVWTRIAWVLGLHLPTAKGATPADAETLRVAYFESRGATSMVDLVREWDPVAAAAGKALDDSAIIESANQDIDRYGSKRPAFDDLFLSQCAVALERLRPALVDDVAAFLWTRMKGESAGESPAAFRDLAADNFIGALRTRYTEAGTAFELPSVQIPAAIIAAKVSSGHKFKHGDYWDIRHARFALPYCTHFLTERSLASLVVSNPGNASNLYQCKVLSDDAAIANELHQIAS